MSSQFRTGGNQAFLDSIVNEQITVNENPNYNTFFRKGMIGSDMRKYSRVYVTSARVGRGGKVTNVVNFSHYVNPSIKNDLALFHLGEYEKADELQKICNYLPSNYDDEVFLNKLIASGLGLVDAFRGAGRDYKVMLFDYCFGKEDAYRVASLHDEGLPEKPVKLNVVNTEVSEAVATKSTTRKSATTKSGGVKNVTSKVEAGSEGSVTS